MMNDKEYAELKLRAMIVPHQVRWPAPQLLHWQKLHAVANEARERVSRAHTRMDEVDRNADFSRDDKYRQRSKTAAQAIADFEASKTLARAREAVDSVIQQWKRDEQHVSTEIAEATLKAMKEAEAGWQRAIDMIVERAAQTKVPGGARCGALISGRIQYFRAC
jgi:hypothetical protein